MSRSPREDDDSNITFNPAVLAKYMVKKKEIVPILPRGYVPKVKKTAKKNITKKPKPRTRTERQPRSQPVKRKKGVMGKRPAHLRDGAPGGVPTRRIARQPVQRRRPRQPVQRSPERSPVRREPPKRKELPREKVPVDKMASSRAALRRLLGQEEPKPKPKRRRPPVQTNLPQYYNSDDEREERRKRRKHKEHRRRYEERTPKRKKKKRKPVYDDYFESDESDDFVVDDDDDQSWRRALRGLTGYDPGMYGAIDRASTRDMETGFRDQLAEESRSLRLGKLEDREILKYEKMREKRRLLQQQGQRPRKKQRYS